MSAAVKASALAPFRVRAFRFQWPADLATSWAFEMETLILGWYMLVETRSVLLFTLFVSLQYLGTLIAPMMGVMADRLGSRNVLCAMRAFYALLASSVMVLTLLGALSPTYVFVSAALMGLVRPSDVGMRAAVVGATMPAPQLVAAMGIQRTTQDSARIAGALTGAGLVAVIGMGPAYLVVASLYALSTFLTFQAGTRATGAAAATTEERPSPWRDLKEGLAYVWRTPHLLAIMSIAFLLNMTSFPLFNGLLPYVAREIYHTDQTGLSYMVAGAGFGSLVGSILLSRHGTGLRPMRAGIIGAFVWYFFLVVFANVPHHAAGVFILFLAGIGQSVSQVPVTAVLLRTAGERFRARVMGIRMLAIYGNVPGLLLAGKLIEEFGYRATASFYCLTASAVICCVAWRWRSALWAADAPANAR